MASGHHIGQNSSRPFKDHRSKCALLFLTQLNCMKIHESTQFPIHLNRWNEASQASNQFFLKEQKRNTPAYYSPHPVPIVENHFQLWGTAITFRILNFFHVSTQGVLPHLLTLGLAISLGLAGKVKTAVTQAQALNLLVCLGSASCIPTAAMRTACPGYPLV